MNRKARVFQFGLCRGDGKVYIPLACGDGISPTASSEIDGESVPCRIVRSKEGNYVLALADFNHSQKVTIKLQDRSKKVVGKKKITTSPLAIPLVSKMNGVLRKDRCNTIRNIDEKGTGRILKVTVDCLIPALDGFILRGRVGRANDFNPAGVAVFDENGLLVGRSSGFLNGPDKCDAALFSSCDLYYSVFVPERVKGVCVSAVDENGHHIGAFTSVEKRYFKVEKEKSWEKFATAFGAPSYASWFNDFCLTKDAALAQSKVKFEDGPFFSVIVPLYKTPLHFFREMADSVLSQTYENWELVLVNSTPEDFQLHELVEEYAARDKRVRYVDLDGNYGITENTNRGIAVARGNYLSFFDHDDVLEPDILFEYARAICDSRDIDLLYCDEDKMFSDGRLGNPSFKPDFSIDMVRDNNYVCHLLTVRRAAYDGVEKSSAELDGAQDHALVLKIAEQGGVVHHVPKVLYHWRMSETSTAANADSKPYATIAGIGAVQQHLDRIGLPGTVTQSHGRAFRYRVDYEVPDSLKASIVVCTRGDKRILSNLLESLAKASYKNWELIIVAGGEGFFAAEEVVKTSALAEKVCLHETGKKYSYSTWMNFGASYATGEALLFIHDDVTPVNDDWLNVLLGFACRSDVGAVGTLVTSEDGIIQQAGLTYVGEDIIELSSGFHESLPGYIYFPHTVRNVAAVGGVCLATSRDVFGRIGGFDEKYSFDYADVDYCFKVKAAGYLVAYTPEAGVRHVAVTDYGLIGRQRSRRHFDDKALLLTKWADVFAAGDSCYNVNFSRDSRGASLYRLNTEWAYGRRVDI